MTHLNVTLAALALAAGAAIGAPQALASGTHTCRQGDPPLVASATTSCPFAARIFSTVDGRFNDQVTWYGQVRSPVTRRLYVIECQVTSPTPWPGFYHVHCSGPHGISVRFEEEVAG